MSGNVMVLSTEKAARRAQIEMHIDMHRDSAAGSLLEVGRWLNSAKDEGVVSHGQWTAWVAEHAAMSERTAQKWMQAARELPEGSPLARLGISKIQSLMMLDSGEREAFAVKIGAESLSSREVEAQVKAARAERDEALRVVGEQKRAFSTKAAECKDQARLLREADRKIVAIESELRTKTNEVNSLNFVLAQRATETNYLREQLEKEKQHKAEPDPKQERAIRELQEILEKKEREIDRLSEALDEAQTAAMRGGMAGGGERPSPVTMILSAIGGLMAQAGRMPGELARMQGLESEDRELLCGQARMVGQWAMQILAACGEGDVHV